MDGYAIDEVSKAYLLADDRDAFRHEKWVNDLIKETASAADQNESAALVAEGHADVSGFDGDRTGQRGMEEQAEGGGDAGWDAVHLHARTVQEASGIGREGLRLGGCR